ncbi:30S ribosomal protein S16 [Saccharicrinis sp. FJH62]|uniref:30S ribosomal protein S16 n=1 Tax=Saccharicrinis sp. FJH62 TaxID=3344657 RepID=UPI0035D51798
MPTKIRLARHGRKGYAFYHIVIADSRAPRDGKFIERIGSYNPNTNPATIDLNFDRALDWVLKGAQPTDTARSILSKEGVMYMKHLLGGVRKGAFDEAEAQKRFESWKADKTKQLANQADDLSAKEKAAENARLEQEKKINEERAAAIAAQQSELAAEEAAEETTEEAAEAEEVETAEAPAEEPVAEEAATEEAPVEEPKASEEAEKPEASDEEEKKEA